MRRARRQKLRRGLRRGLRLMALLGCLGGLSGCAQGPLPRESDARANGTVISLRPARVSAAQACAIGYDLSRAIHATVSLRRTVLLAPSRANSCERHALHYLRRAGFRVDETGAGTGVRLRITLDRAGQDADGQPLVTAIATLGGDLRIARPYRPVRSGVFAAGPVSIQHLNPDTYARRGS